MREEWLEVDDLLQKREARGIPSSAWSLSSRLFASCKSTRRGLPPFCCKDVWLHVLEVRQASAFIRGFDDLHFEIPRKDKNIQNHWVACKVEGDLARKLCVG